MSVLRRWTKDEVALLGTMSDADIARRLRISQHAVGRHRKYRGIAKYSPAGRRRKALRHRPQACICCMRNTCDVGDYCRRCADELYVVFLEEGIPPQGDTQRG